MKWMTMLDRYAVGAPLILVFSVLFAFGQLSARQHQGIGGFHLAPAFCAAWCCARPVRTTGVTVICGAAGDGVATVGTED